jgi:hypothetical protein
MQSRTRSRILSVGVTVAILLILALGVSSAQGPGPRSALGTSFTYQGLLTRDGDPLDSACDFQFGLWDDPITGTLVAGPLSQPGVPLSAGRFTVLLDFGDVFDGTALWLEAAVQCPGDAAPTPLPRQALTATPYAVYTRHAPWSGLVDVPAGFADNVDNDTTYSAGTGLVLTSTTFALAVPYQFPQSCGDGQVAKWTGSTWVCANDDMSIVVSGTNVFAGEGLYAVTRSNSITLNVLFAGPGGATTVARSDHNHDSAYVNEGQFDSVTSAMIVNGTVTAFDLLDGTALSEILDDDGPGSGLDADLLDSRQSGNANGNVPVSNGTLNTNLNADLLDGQHASAFAPASHTHDHGALTGLGDDDHPQYFNLSQNETVAGIPAFNGGASGSIAPFSVDSNYLVTNLNADLLDGQHASAFAPASHNHDASYWKLTGNGGTTPGTNFLGTTDNQALEFKVNGQRALRLEPNAISPNVVGGYSGNGVTAGVQGAAIGGGGASGYANRVTDHYGVVGGGYNNRAGDNAGTTDDAPYATVGGGYGNTASSIYATIGGGYSNAATGAYCTVGGGYDNTTGSFWYGTVGGGYQNTASGKYSAIAGGWGNTASGMEGAIGGGYDNIASGYATAIPGGLANTAQGDGSFAAGRRAKANNLGCFVWGDYTDADVSCNDNNRWVARASGGVYFYTNAGLSSGVYVPAGGNAWSSVSDRNLKENFSPVDGREVLARLAQMPISTWNYKSQDPAIRHIGPMAQDFAAFGVGEDDTHISTVDADGVALAAIQGLYQEVQEKDARIADLEARVAALEQGGGGRAGDSGLLPVAVAALAVGLLLGFVLVKPRKQGGGR